MQNILKAIRIYKLQYKRYEYLPEYDSAPEYIDILMEDFKVQPFDITLKEAHNNEFADLHDCYGLDFCTDDESIVELRFDHFIAGTRWTAIIELDNGQITEMESEDMLVLGKATSSNKEQQYIDIELFDNIAFLLYNDIDNTTAETRIMIYKKE